MSGRVEVILVGTVAVVDTTIGKEEVGDQRDQRNEYAYSS